LQLLNFIANLNRIFYVPRDIEQFKYEYFGTNGHPFDDANTTPSFPKCSNTLKENSNLKISRIALKHF